MKYFELAIMCHAINYVNYEIIMGNVILRKTHQQGGIFIWLKLLVAENPVVIYYVEE